MEQMIRRKTHNLTWSRIQNGQINHPIKAFHSTFWKTKIHSSSDKFFLFPQRNLYFKHSLDMEMSLKEEKNKIFEDVFQKVWSLKNPRIIYTIKERGYKRWILCGL